MYKGVWWMPRLSEAKKDAIGCEKLWVLAEYELIHRYPNGATPPYRRYRKVCERAELKHLSRHRRRKQK